MGSLATVIVSSYNRPTLVVDALESLLAQTWGNIEVIVADDSSNEPTTRVLEKFQRRFTAKGIRCEITLPGYEPTPRERQHGQRCAICINAAMPFVRGDFVCYLPDDDFMPPNSVEVRARYLMEHPAVNVVYGRLMTCRSLTGQPVAGIHYESTQGGCVHDTNSFWQSEPLECGANKLDHSMFMVRRLPKIPLWPELPTPEFDCEDAGFLFRCYSSGIGPCDSVDSVVTVKRQHRFGHRSDPARRE